MNPDILVIFTRFPETGKTKTRLISYLGADGAALLQKEMTEYTVKQARRTAGGIEIRYTGGSLEQMRDWLGEDLQYVEQGEGDLGERMERAFADHFLKDANQVVVVGSDCPSNGWKNLREAFEALDQSDGVLGPANDGGYYLIGLSKPAPQLFQGIDWGAKQVFAQTLAAAGGLSVRQLKPLNDVDLPEDIPPKISVVIPTLNEANFLPQTMARVQAGFNTETIVVDGGSSDGTPYDLECTDGRAAQQNLGAATAQGQLLLFLHADTLLPEGWDWIVRDTLSDPSVAAGAFTFKIKEQIPGFKFVESSANWRSRVCSLPYGDQGLFMRRETFDHLGGFPDMPIMEDYALVHSLRRFGKVVTVPQAALTSGRRWKKYGVFKVTLINRLMIFGYHLGISPARLASFYRRR